MENNIANSVGSSSVVSDVQDPNPENLNTENQDSKKGDSVAYETYRRSVSNEKKLKGRLSALEEELGIYKAAEKKKEDEELERKGEYDKIKNNLLEELQGVKDENKTLKQERTDARKLDAFLGALPGKVEQKYWGLIDIDSVAIDPDTNMVDAMSVTKAVDLFKTAHPRLIDGVGGPRVYDGAPATSGSGLTYEEWLKLPADEMQKRYKELKENIARNQ